MVKVIHLVILTVLCYFNIDTTLGNPGLKTRITYEQLDYASNVAIDHMTENLKKISDQSGWIGLMQCDITALEIDVSKRPKTKLTLIQNRGIFFEGNECDISIKGNWETFFQLLFIKIPTAYGTFGVSARRFSILFTTDKDSDDRPRIIATRCDVGIQSASVDVYGMLSWFYDIYQMIIGLDIDSTFGSLLCNVLTDLINEDIETLLSDLQFDVPFGENFSMDLRLAKEPMVQDSFVETSHKGEVLWKSAAIDLPFSAEVFPLWNDTTQMNLWLSDFMINSFLYRAQARNLLQYYFAAKDLPPAARSALSINCDSLRCIGKLIPTLREDYPESQIEFNIESTSFPNVTIAPGGIQVYASVAITFYANSEIGRNHTNQTSILLFSLAVDMAIAADVQTINGMVYGRLLNNNFRVQVNKTAKGINGIYLKFIANTAFNKFVTPAVNAWGARGFSLPAIKDFDFVNPQVTLLERALLLSTDLKHKSG